VATYSLVHGAWHGGWAWDLVRAELEARGHTVHAPDLPVDDVAATVEDYARCVPPADVVVGHSLGGFVVPLVEARVHVFLCALLAGLAWKEVFAPGFGAARERDELGRSYYPDPADAARELQYPPEHAELVAKLRRQAPLEPAAGNSLLQASSFYVVCTRDAVIRPEWQRRAPYRQVELESGHMPTLECPAALADLLERETGVV
jgi:pimeloyl-ACP methyl ester carboxylesterase